MSLDKVITKKILTFHGVRVPESTVISTVEEVDRNTMSFPLIIKPAREDASIGICAESVVYDVETLQAAAVDMIKRYSEVIIETYIEGREFNVSILGNNPPTVLALSEIDFSQMPSDMPNIVSYRAKWIKESMEYKGSQPLCPAQIADGKKILLEKYALIAYKSMGLRDYGRIDFRMNSSGELFVIDVNANPCISPDAGFARAAEACGMKYEDVISSIVACAIHRKKEAHCI